MNTGHLTIEAIIEAGKKLDRAEVREYFFICPNCNRELPPTEYCLDRHLIREACKTDQ